MTTAEMKAQHEPISTRSASKARDVSRDVESDRSLERTVETEPKLNAWMTLAAGSVVPLGLACAATTATYLTTHERVAVAAWISVAVVGTASVVAAAAVSQRRVVHVDRNTEGHRISNRDSENHRNGRN